MNFFSNIGSGISQAIDTVVEKNRRHAYINRLNYVIQGETETLNRAYIALGKHFYKNLNGDPENTEVERLCKVIDVAQERLKKAQDRLEYVIMYGIPETNKPNDEKTEDSIDADILDEYDEGDITICVSDSAEIKTKDGENAGPTENSDAAASDSAESDAEKTAEPNGDAPSEKNGK